MISVVIPAYNETEKIVPTVNAARQALPGASEIIVVDDCSKDDTWQKAQGAGAKVLRMQRRMGKGAALMQGTVEAGGDIVVFLDADIGETAGEIRKLIQPIANDEADMAVARFPDLSPTKRTGFGVVKLTAYCGVR